jgi:hypothetical protein
LEPVQPFTFVVSTATGTTGPGATIQLDALVPLHLVVGVTASDAEAAINSAAQAYVTGLTGAGLSGASAQITADGLIAALRDDTRYQIIRNDTSVTTESADRFFQLADGVGAHPVGPGDTVVLRSIDIDVREGGV